MTGPTDKSSAAHSSSISNGLNVLFERSNTLLVDTVVTGDTGAL